MLDMKGRNTSASSSPRVLRTWASSRPAQAVEEP